MCTLNGERNRPNEEWVIQRANNTMHRHSPTYMGEQERRFEGKVCLVTGGGSGIGKATCHRFAQEGGKVVVVDIEVEHGQETVSEITKAGGEAIFAAADVGNSQQVQSSIKAAVDKWGKLDVIVNNAAIMSFSPVVDLDEEKWEKVIQVNLGSNFLYCKYGVPHMPEGSAIVSVSSVHAHETTKNVVPYASSKGGIEAFARGVSEELAPKKIRINCVAPGAVNTPMLWDNPNVKSGVEKIEGAVGQPDDIAAAICFLAADEARFITGTTLVVDGGRLDILP